MFILHNLFLASKLTHHVAIHEYTGVIDAQILAIFLKQKMTFYKLIQLTNTPFLPASQIFNDKHLEAQ